MAACTEADRRASGPAPCLQEHDPYSKPFLLLPIVGSGHASVLVGCHLDKLLHAGSDSGSGTPGMLHLDSGSREVQLNLAPLCQLLEWAAHKVRPGRNAVSHWPSSRPHTRTPNALLSQHDHPGLKLAADSLQTVEASVRPCPHAGGPAACRRSAPHLASLRADPPARRP